MEGWARAPPLDLEPTRVDFLPNPLSPTLRKTTSKPCSIAKLSTLQVTVALQQKQIETLTAQLKEQSAQIQKVSAQVETSKPATKVVNNP